MTEGAAESRAWYVKGDDSTLVAERVRVIVAEQSGGDPFSVEDLSGDDVEAGAIAEACGTPPFLGERRVVVVRDVGRFSAEELKPVVGWLEHPLPTTSLVLGAGGGKVSQTLINAVRKVGTVIDVSAGSGRERSKWFDARLARSPLRLDREAAGRLAEHLGEDVGRLPALLDGLAMAYGERAGISVEQLEPFLGEAGAVAPWDLTDAIDAGDTGQALAHLRRMMEAGDRHPLVIMATLQRHYGGMLRLDGSGITDEKAAAEVLGTTPYPAKKALTKARQLGGNRIGEAIELLARADLDLRGTSGLAPEVVMEVLVARLASRFGGHRAGRR